MVKLCFTAHSQGIQPRCPLFSKNITWSPSASPLSRGDPINNIMSSSQMLINYRRGYPVSEAMGYYDTLSSLRTHGHLSGPCWACFPIGNLVSISCWDVTSTVEPERCCTNQHIRDRKQWLYCKCLFFFSGCCTDISSKSVHIWMRLTRHFLYSEFN